MFDLAHSILERSPEIVAQLVRLIEDELGGGLQVRAITEVGSFAKHEAVPESDIDLRVYATSPTFMLYNAPNETVVPVALKSCATELSLSVRVIDWATTNYPLWEKASAVAGCCINLGIADCRYARRLVAEPNRWPSTEPSLLLQSNVVFDTSDFVPNLRSEFSTTPEPALVEFLISDVRKRLVERLPTFVQPHPADEHKAAEGGQILWVAHAVRCIRDAVAVLAYSSSGTFVHRKEDVLRFLDWLPDGQFELVERLYEWKTDPAQRRRLFAEFGTASADVYARFRSVTPALKECVETILGRLRSDG